MPCNYKVGEVLLELFLKIKNISKEYKKSQDPQDGIDPWNKSYFWLSVTFDSEGRLEKEVWAYEAISFIGDIGGSLGLFIGVSFLSVWDFGEYVIYKYKQYRN